MAGADGPQKFPQRFASSPKLPRPVRPPVLLFGSISRSGAGFSEFVADLEQCRSEQRHQGHRSFVSPRHMSLPGPPFRTSLPPPPLNRSLPGPAISRSLPVPPQIRSFPPRPRIVSFPQCGNHVTLGRACQDVTARCSENGCALTETRSGRSDETKLPTAATVGVDSRNANADALVWGNRDLQPAVRGGE